MMMRYRLHYRRRHRRSLDPRVRLRLRLRNSRGGTITLDLLIRTVTRMPMVTLAHLMIITPTTRLDHLRRNSRQSLALWFGHGMIMIMDTDMVMVMVDRCLLYRLAIIGRLLRHKHERSLAPGLNPGLSLPRIHIRKYESRRHTSTNPIERRKYQTTHRFMENKDQIGETTSNSSNGWIR
jgi:hypothetical protein